MKYPKQYLEEIKSRLKVSSVVGKYVKLTKRGKEFVGLSPFTNEKTPSFTVNDQKFFYHCFSSSEHGNIFDFLMKTQNFKFGEAVKKLAADAGMPVYRFSKIDEEREKKWKIYNEILERYANFCNQELTSLKYTDVKKYLDFRKINKEQIDFFKIGYAGFKNDFYVAQKNKFKNEELLNSGLFYLDEKNNKLVERFRGRIVFPIKNINGAIIAFGGRVITNTKFAKYINSPETSFYKKGNNIFNFNEAKKIVNKKDEIFFVEGYMDVITLHKFGIKNVVANQGTALTENQLELAWRYFKNITIFFDGDDGGQNAAIRAAEKLFPLLKPDHNIYFLFLSKNDDPDTFINNNGKAGFEELNKQKLTINDFIWNYNFYNIDQKNPSSLASFEKKMKNLCKEIKDQALSKYYLESFLAKINLLTPNINFRKSNFINYNRAYLPLKETKLKIDKLKNYTERKLKEYSIIYIIINFPQIFENDKEIFPENIFSEEILNDLKQELKNVVFSKENYDKDKLNKEIFFETRKNKKFHNLIEEIENVAQVKIILSNKSENEIKNILSDLCLDLQKIGINAEIEKLENKMINEMSDNAFKDLVDKKNELKNKLKTG
ncbi:MAG: DNA primase [Candidatus Pelagibacter sp. TMED64]|nr:DNA primase [Candidatus Pelagibacter sp.]OUU65898.1 MAG: DNA primase [Candidatus Pelagibacter sp. TMED64]|tara:strand:+ start:2703 stop:4517 length:1815 start_codon:yes stop_codon:yes gene_type:complete